MSPIQRLLVATAVILVCAALHGQRDLAVEFFQHCFYGNECGDMSQALATAELQKLGVAPPYGQQNGNEGEACGLWIT